MKKEDDGDRQKIQVGKTRIESKEVSSSSSSSSFAPGGGGGGGGGGGRLSVSALTAAI